MPRASLEQAHQILKERFGHSQFRSHQEAVIDRILQGGSAQVIMPTGMGKSLCYQLPALVLDGLTVVVSPLIALMEDQVSALRAKGIAATFINATVPRAERDKRMSELAKTKLLYVTPERFRKPEFRSALEKVKVSLLAIDEAHCVSQWGHDFRPDFSRLGEVRQWLDSPPTLTLTATATPLVREDIRRSLGLSAETPFFMDGIARPNLFLAVSMVHGADDKLRHLVALRHQHRGSAIYYFSLISSLEGASRELQRLGIAHGKYHGQLPDEMRRYQQKRFMSGEDELILATPAFGLGIDKPDIRLIAHFEIPGSIEAYYQEIGRAGRDGRPAQCTLLYDPDDVTIQMDFIKWANPDPGFISALFTLLQKNPLRVRAEGQQFLREQLNFHNRRDFRVETALNLLERWDVIDWPHHDMSQLKLISDLPAELLDTDAHAQRLKGQNQKLLEMVRWIGLDSCRRRFIHEYFGVPSSLACGHCDYCAGAGV